MAYTQSILDTVRGAIGLVADDTSFDSELIIHINSNKHPHLQHLRTIITIQITSVNTVRCMPIWYYRLNSA